MYPSTIQQTSLKTKLYDIIPIGFKFFFYLFMDNIIYLGGWLLLIE